MNQSNRSSLKLIAAGVAGAIVALGGVQWLERAEAQAPQMPGAPAEQSFPGLEIRDGSIALVRGPGNQYFVVDRLGNGYPVRFRDQDLVVPVGFSLLNAP